jgi:NADPH oxidase
VNFAQLTRQQNLGIKGWFLLNFSTGPGLSGYFMLLFLNLMAYTALEQRFERFWYLWVLVSSIPS